MRTTMMMLAAALLTAACGSTSAPQADDDAGPGSGSGSGVMDTSCTTGADCDPGLACATDTHQCVAAAFTLDKAGFYDDGTRWWTATDAPTLHGTIDDTSGQPLEVSVAGTAIGTATIDGTTWSIALPAGSIHTTDTVVALRLGALEQAQAFALDDAVPTVTLFGSVKDERGDAIDFATGEPVHTHNGAPVDLTGTGCPAVYKYAYLMDETAPLYGREVSPNPLAWQIKVSDATPIDSMDSAYRVRDESGRVLYDWTSIQPDATGVFSVALYRNAIPELGTYAGKIHVDVRFRDSFGNETTRETCWDNHPMAAPIEVQPLATGELFGWTLAADDPISNLMNYYGATVYTQRFVQHVAEPITIHVSAPLPTVHYTMTGVDDMVAGTPTATTLSCPGATTGSCAAVTDPADKIASGTATGRWAIQIVDDATGELSCSAGGLTLACTLPARTASEAPHAYRLELKISDVPELWPYSDLFTSEISYGENFFAGLTYAGLAPKAGPTACTHVSTHFVNGQLVYNCTERTPFTEIRALDKATLAFPRIAETLTTSATATGLAEAPGYVTSGLVVDAATWNAGNDDLPGPQ